ncbi:MAG: DNA-binding protein [Oscillospiraceae bacterium]|nr:DNA-binding protein [Oscillospiraceae bacterium]
MNLLDKLTFDDLDEEQRELADCIGMEAYKKLVYTYAGSIINVRTPKMLTREIRNKIICSEFDGGNYNALAIKYHLSNRMIRKIVDVKGK